MAIRVYQGTITEGGTDGVAVSEHGSANGEMAPIVIEGLYPTGATVSKPFTFAVRCDEGEEYWGVCVTFWDYDYNKLRCCVTANNSKYTSLDSGSANSVTAKTAFIPRLTDKNVVINASAYAMTDEIGTTDTKTNIYITWAERRTV